MMTRRFCVLLAALLFVPQLASAAEAEANKWLAESKRLVFLGDSITAAGVYIADFDAWLVSRRLENTPEIIDCGLPSETVSGLSEAGHAGGAFPRPDLHERLERVLKLAKPDLVIACYGINCGIYEPFADERFERYQQGILKLKKRVEEAGAHLIVVTPPFYDDMRAPRPFSYNKVLDRYSDWLLGQRKAGWQVIDLHGPMTREVERRRKTDPEFAFQRDGVHPGDAGHWFIAQQLIRFFGDDEAAAAETPEAMLAARGLPKELFETVRRRVDVLKNAYVAAAGHKRPGVAKGLPVAEAEATADKLSAEIRKMAATAGG